MTEKPPPVKKKIRHVPTVLQMEAAECGAAALAMIMAYHKKYVPLEELRIECGISRDGSKASNMIKAAAKYGFDAHGYRKEPEGLAAFNAPMIVHWNFNHFVVFEGITNKHVCINDPAFGRRKISAEEFDRAFTGVVLTFDKTIGFKDGGQKNTIVSSLKKRLSGSESSLLFILLIGLMLVVPGMAVPAFLRIFVDEILLKSMKDLFNPLLIAMSATLVVRGILLWLQAHYLLKFETKLAVLGSSKFFWHLLRLPVDFFTQRYSGEISSRIAINDSVATMLSGKLASVVLDCIVVVFYLVLLFQYDIYLTITGLLVALCNILFLRHTSRKIIDGNYRLSLDRSRMIGIAMIGIQLIESIKANGNEPEFFRKWSGYQAKLMNSEKEMGEIAVTLQTVPGFLSGINIALLLVFGGLRVMDGQMSIGMLVAFQTLMISFLDPVARLVDMGVVMHLVKGDINRLDDVFNYTPDTLSADPLPDSNEEPQLRGHVELKNVNFGYNRLEPPFIKNFNLTVRPGIRVALVGSSGSGKSTIARIIAGLNAPWSGDILFDGRPRSAIPKNTITSSIALVDQDITVFEDSVKNNLTLWDDTIPKSRIIAAARDAAIHDDLSIRSNGYGHVIEEGGRNFSGGQRQRLEIARALVVNPSILILDEATSALDPKTEEEVSQNIRKRGCTCILIAHRLSTIRDCDEIIVIDKGAVVQRGNHEQLKDIDGIYRELIKTI